MWSLLLLILYIIIGVGSCRPLPSSSGGEDLMLLNNTDKDSVKENARSFCVLHFIANTGRRGGRSGLDGA